MGLKLHFQGLIMVAVFSICSQLNAQQLCRFYLSSTDSLVRAQEDFEQTWYDYEASSKKKNLRGHLNASQKLLDLHGIDYSKESIGLLIQPNLSSEVNRFAKRVFSRFGILTFYDPKGLMEKDCGACVSYSQNYMLDSLSVSREMIQLGRLTSSEVHEWRHLVETNKVTLNKKIKKLSVFAQSEQSIQSRVGRIDTEEYLTYLTELQVIRNELLSEKISEADFKETVDAIQNFLKEHNFQAMDSFSELMPTLSNLRKNLKALNKAFEVSELEVDILAGRIGIQGAKEIEINFFPLRDADSVYRTEVTIIANKNNYMSLLLQEPFKMPSVDSFNFETYSKLVREAYAQFIDVQLFIYEFQSLLNRDLKTREDYFQFIGDYRKTLRPYL